MATEYALTLTIVVGLTSLLFIFYQSFVQANLYGSAGKDNAVFLLSDQDKSLGLHRVAALPYP